MLYQDFNSKGGDYFKLERGGNLSFPPHIHSSFEIITITHGCLDVIVNNEIKHVKKGESALIFPNQIHEFRSTQENEYVICIFPPSLFAHILSRLKEKFLYQMYFCLVAI